MHKNFLGGIYDFRGGCDAFSFIVYARSDDAMRLRVEMEMDATLEDHERLRTIPSELIVRQKRRHTKSRSGCVTCKLRRVKVGLCLFVRFGSSCRTLLVRCLPIPRSAMKSYHTAGSAQLEACTASMQSCP